MQKLDKKNCEFVESDEWVSDGGDGGCGQTRRRRRRTKQTRRKQMPIGVTALVTLKNPVVTHILTTRDQQPQ